MAVITQYNTICNLGKNIDEVYQNALDGDFEHFDCTDKIIKDKMVRIARIRKTFNTLDNEDYNLRCNHILLNCIKLIDTESLITRYGENNIAIVIATTNTGVEEFEKSHNYKHAQLGNPAEFLHKLLRLNNFYTTVSTACSSGIKAFSIAQNLLNSDLAKVVIVAGVDTITKVPVYGFDSLGILSDIPTNPFSQNRCGINIGEGAGIFVLEKDCKKGIKIKGIGENTDTYHSTTPDPMAKAAVNCIEKALYDAKLEPEDIQYINLHGTGTIANDVMEAAAVNRVFGTSVLSSSTKPMTGHCLGASAIIETALCCKLLDNFTGHVFPHIYDGIYDKNIKPIRLASKNDVLKKVTNCLCLSFGFGGTNTAMIIGKGEYDD